VEQDALLAGRRRPAFGQREGFAGFSFALQVSEDLLDHRRIFDAGDDFHRATAFLAGLDVDIENALEALRPGHRGPPSGGCWRFFGFPGLVAPAPPGRGDHGAMPAVRGEHAMEAGEVDLGSGHQGRQPCHEIQRIKDTKMTCVVPSRYGVFSW
jgi:hypothetical protein